MLLTYNNLIKLIEDGVIDALPENVNGSSIDIRLGPELLVESLPTLKCPSCAGIIKYRGKPKDVYTNPLVKCSSDSCAPYHFYDVAVPVDPSKKEPLNMRKVNLGQRTRKGYALMPGESVLAHSVEVFRLPGTISGEYKLKSSLARVFLEHLNAGWADPWWQGSTLTLELRNESRYHPLQLWDGMKIGQVVFFEGEEVPFGNGYGVRGQYNNDTSVSQSKGVK